MQPFDARWPCPFAPLSTLRLPPHSDRRMTRGEGGRLLLPSAGLPPAVLRQLAWRTPAWSLNRPGRPFVVGVLQPMSLPPSSAPTATGWSDSCRAGFAPAEEWRLVTAHRIEGIVRDANTEARILACRSYRLFIRVGRHGQDLGGRCMQSSQAEHAWTDPNEDTALPLPLDVHRNGGLSVAAGVAPRACTAPAVMMASARSR